MISTRPTRAKRIRVVIADDHPIVREGLRALLKTQREMQVVDEAASGHEAIEKTLLHRPDLVLLDIRMPKMDGITAIRTILEKVPTVKIIVVSNYGGDQDIYRALHAGAMAYLLKDTPHKELLECIRTVHAGRRWIPPYVGEQLAQQIEQPKLTDREMQITHLMAKGKSNKEIGAELEISESTVKVHVGHIFKKLGATGRLDALRIVLQRGILHLHGHMEI